MSKPTQKMLFVTELSGHGDEGMRNWLKMVGRAMARRDRQTEILRLEGDPRWSAFLPASLQTVHGRRPDVLIYTPYSGLTSKALMRHAALRAAAGARLDVLATLQADSGVRRLPRALSPMCAVFASERLRSAHRDVARKSFVLPPVIDQQRFRPSTDPRSAIREELGLSGEKPMVLHVGHLRRSRGLEPLADLALEGKADVVMIASTATDPESGIEAQLQTAGVFVKREYLPAIERWYQAADVYMFPVVDLQGSIEIPLTVLEAMACGTPVASSPFGGLPSLFATNESLRFAPAAKLAQTALAMIGVEGDSNRLAVNEMNQDSFVDAFEHVIAEAAHG